MEVDGCLVGESFVLTLPDREIKILVEWLSARLGEFVSHICM